jgi:ornithine cyclodeaminase
LEITLFDGVGFALEDFSVLRFVDELSTKLGIFTELNMVPQMSDPKDLIGFLR